MKKPRCLVCNKKTSLIPFTCRCDPKAHFCSLHRLDHNCTFDYKKEQQEKLVKENPLVVADKITGIK